MLRGLVAIALCCVVACEHGKGGGIPPTDGGSGLACGGFTGEQCPPDEFCDFPRNSCGASDEQGTCRARPFGCPRPVFQPTCGCDGEVRGNECEANAAGFDVSDIGGCFAEPDQFACGHVFCTIDTQFCQRFATDIGDEPDSFSCNQLPSGCDVNPNCFCLTAEPCGENCTGDRATGMEVTCFGG